MLTRYGSPILKLDATYCIVFPDGDPIESNKTLDRLQLQFIDAQRQLYTLPLSAFPDFLERRPFDRSTWMSRDDLPSAIRDASIIRGEELLAADISITFDPSLSPEQIKATLTAFANYYRACGGNRPFRGVRESGSCYRGSPRL